jgi:arylsulfatase A-like enzyme
MDNLGYGEVGVYGGGDTRGAPTPRIDRLAAEGTRLTNFNVEAQCTPSRSAIMIGRFAIRSGTHSVSIGEGTRRSDAVGSNDRRASVRLRLRHRALWQMAPRE